MKSRRKNARPSRGGAELTSRDDRFSGGQVVLCQLVFRVVSSITKSVVPPLVSVSTPVNFSVTV